MSDRDRDLPILDELGAEFAEMVGAKEDERPRARRRASTLPSRASRERRSQARRIGRRAAVVAVLVCLVGGVAVAALRGGGGSGNRADTTPTPLGSAEDGAWTFSVHRDRGRLCGLFVPRGGEPSDRCGIAPRSASIAAQSAIGDGRRYVFGLAGPDVARIEVSLEEPEATGSTWRSGAGHVLPPTDPDAAADAGFPSGDRWFVLDLGPVDGRSRGEAPAVVTAFDQGGRRVGRPYVDCSLGIVGEACRRRIEAAADG